MVLSILDINFVVVSQLEIVGVTPPPWYPLEPGVSVRTVDIDPLTTSTVNPNLKPSPDKQLYNQFIS